MGDDKPLLKAASFFWVMLCIEAFMAIAKFVMYFSGEG